MSGSELGEMALESSQAVVMPKFDMHIYTSTLTIKELKEAITEYCIPTDLHPRLPPPKLTMDKLPPKYIGIYIEQLEQGGLRIPFSTFFLADAMPWIHTDTNVRDDFPTNCNEGDAERLAEFTIRLCPPPRHLLYVCGLTKTCRHPELSYSIKDPDRKVLTMDDFLKLSVWNRTVRSIKKPNSKIAVDREKKDQQNLAKAQANRVGEGGSISPQKKRAYKNQESTGSRSEGTISVTPLHKAAPKLVDETTTSIPKDIAENVAIGSQIANIEREVVDLNHSFHSAHHKDNDKNTADHQFVPEWGLCDDLRICSFRAQKVEMIKKLEETLEPKSKQLADAKGRIKVLEGEKTTLVAELAQAEMDRHKLVREFISAVVKRLHISMEYQNSLAVPIGLCFTSGWLGGLSLGMKQEEIVAMLSETSNLDIEGSKAWKDKHHKLFTKQYPYV
ncbi:hypothetical protein Tco_0803221 [Tanacetum coccineum]|uniref:Uncharacterized protein n=1 Tax=Tanacetum coccineum TaxID=301880 RepID=A0ABQ5A150_9ASTR